MMFFLCLVSQVHDGDTLRCATGERVRIAGIEANELRGGCHLSHCAAGTGVQARQIARRMLLGQSLRCQALGQSYRRVVASCDLAGRDVGCELVAQGAAVTWPAYRIRYRLGPCRR